MPDARPDPSAPFWTADETAAYLGLSGKSILALAKQGDLACLRLGPSGGRFRIRPVDVEVYVEACRTGPPGPNRAPVTAPAAPEGLDELWTVQQVADHLGVRALSGRLIQPQESRKGAVGP